MKKRGLLIISIIIILIFSTCPNVISDQENLEKYDKISDIEYVYSSINKSLNIQNDVFIEKTNSQFVSKSSVIPIGPIDSAWPMASHDNHHTGLSQYNTASNPGVEKWRFKSEGAVDTGIAIDVDGTLYFGDFGGRLYALNPDGSLKWMDDAMGTFTTSTPCISEDGTIYIAGHSALVAYSRAGTQLWKIGLGGNAASAPAIGLDGLIHVGHMNNDWVAVYPNGTIKWKYATGNRIVSSAAIADDGTIIFGSADDYVYALNPDGSLKWRYLTQGDVKGSPSIDDDGIIYIASWGDYLHAIYPNGTMKWKTYIEDGSETTPCFGPDGTIYVSYEKLWAINPGDGSIKWAYDYPSQFEESFLSNPAISADGIIFIGVNAADQPLGAIYAINPDGTLRWRKYIADQGVMSSPSIAEDGTIFIGSWWRNGGCVHAFNEWTGTNRPPEKPTYRIILEPALGGPLIIDFKAIDPDLHPLEIHVDWDDLTLIQKSPEIASGYPAYFEHDFPPRPFKTFNVRVKAVDSFGAESDWTVIPISLPVPFQYPAWQWFQSQFPMLAAILNQLIDPLD